MNQASSRSHAIFTITVECSEKVTNIMMMRVMTMMMTNMPVMMMMIHEKGIDKQQHFRVGKLHLVDLAGRFPISNHLRHYKFFTNGRPSFHSETPLVWGKSLFCILGTTRKGFSFNRKITFWNYQKITLVLDVCLLKCRLTKFWDWKNSQKLMFLIIIIRIIIIIIIIIIIDQNCCLQCDCCFHQMYGHHLHLHHTNPQNYCVDPLVISFCAASGRARQEQADRGWRWIPHSLDTYPISIEVVNHHDCFHCPGGNKDQPLSLHTWQRHLCSGRRQKHPCALQVRIQDFGQDQNLSTDHDQEMIFQELKADTSTTRQPWREQQDFDVCKCGAG